MNVYTGLFWPLKIFFLGIIQHKLQRSRRNHVNDDDDDDDDDNDGGGGDDDGGDDDDDDAAGDGDDGDDDDDNDDDDDGNNLFSAFTLSKFSRFTRLYGNFLRQCLLFGFNKIITFFETLWLENYLIFADIFLANLNQAKPNVSGTVAVARSVNKLTTQKITLFFNIPHC